MECYFEAMRKFAFWVKLFRVFASLLYIDIDSSLFENFYYKLV